MDWEMPDDDELSDYGLPQDHKVFAWNKEGYSVSVREWIVRHAAGLSPLTPITLWPLREENPGAGRQRLSGRYYIPLAPITLWPPRQENLVRGPQRLSDCSYSLLLLGWLARG
jgi:hypothetical protein